MSTKELHQCMSPVDRFWLRVDRRGDNECWLWTGASGRKGYGSIMVNGRLTGAYRFAYELLVGPIPEGLEIDHLCRVPACVNPAHLEPVTRRVNTLRGISFSAVNAAKTHCFRGHLFSDTNTRLQDGRRYCRSCERIRSDQRRHPEREAWEAAEDRVDAQVTGNA